MPIPPSEPQVAPSGDALAPLRRPVFRILWLASFTANVCMWMNEVAAAWLMTSLTTSSVMVALVLTASTVPVFLFGLTSGALADILDRRRYFVATQFWVAGVALLSCALVLTGLMNAPLLLVMVFAYGMGLAMRWPVFAAVVPEVVSRDELPAALTLNGIAMNASRIVGPLIAGSVIASAGSGYVFALNAALSLLAGFALLRWKRERTKSVLPGERLIGAVRVGAQYVLQSPHMRSVLLRVAVFFSSAVAMMALLPLVARQLPGGNAGTYTLLLASLGLGAIGAGLLLPRLRGRADRDSVVRFGSLLVALGLVGVAFAPNVVLGAAAMFLAGGAWLAVANTMNVSAQLTLPNWVRARAMAFYQMVLMGSAACGAAVWGKVVDLTDLPTGLLLAAFSGLGTYWLTRGFALEGGDEEDLRPMRPPRAPTDLGAVDPQAGPVLVTIEYLVEIEHVDAFLAVMEETRRRRIQQGAISWELFRDTADPRRFTEYLVDESWVEHLRRFDRMTATDNMLRERRLAFHCGPEEPR
ncbi:MAG: MFS transporter, partial [Burkholderiales bacterium]